MVIAYDAVGSRQTVRFVPEALYPACFQALCIRQEKSMTILALALAVATGVLAGAILSRIGALGSCFEGSCGYVASFVVTPVVALLTFVIWRRWIRKWGPLTLIAVKGAMFGAFALLIIGLWASMIVVIAYGIAAVKLIVRARADRVPLRTLLLHNTSYQGEVPR